MLPTSGETPLDQVIHILERESFGWTPSLYMLGDVKGDLVFYRENNDLLFPLLKICPNNKEPRRIRISIPYTLKALDNVIDPVKGYRLEILDTPSISESDSSEKMLREDMSILLQEKKEKHMNQLAELTKSIVPETQEFVIESLYQMRQDRSDKRRSFNEDRWQTQRMIELVGYDEVGWGWLPRVIQNIMNLGKFSKTAKVNFSIVPPSYVAWSLLHKLAFVTSTRLEEDAEYLGNIGREGLSSQLCNLATFYYKMSTEAQRGANGAHALLDNLIEYYGWYNIHDPIAENIENYKERILSKIERLTTDQL